MGWTFQEGSGAEHSCVELVLNRVEKGYAVEYAITCKQKVNSAYHTYEFVYFFVKNAFMF
jgi:hypothetical protein